MALTVPKADDNGYSLFQESTGPFVALRRAMLRSLFDAADVTSAELETRPALDLYEQDGGYHIDCALPGFKKDDIHVEASGDRVTISGSYKHEQKEHEANYRQREVASASFSRAVALPQEIDRDSVSATFKNGMLHVTMHPAKAIQSNKTIAISD